jgi:magnesium transporter
MLKTQDIPALVASLQKATDLQDREKIKLIAQPLLAADLTLLLDLLPTAVCKFILSVVPVGKAGEILALLETERRLPFLKTFLPEELAPLLNHMESDDVADILNEQHDALFLDQVTALLAENKAKDVKNLLHYDGDCAGGLMSAELIKVNVNWTVQQCMEEIKKQGERVKKVFSVYVVDDNEVFLGRVSLKTIIISDKETKISAIYLTDVMSIETYQSQEMVVQVMQKYDLETIPVVNVQGKLVGRIMIDDVIDVMQEQAETDRRAMVGLTEDVDEADSVWKLARARLPWLLIGMFGGLAGATLLRGFEKELLLIPAMAFFIPLITATGGNVGIQSSSLIVQSLAESSQYKITWYARLLKSLLVAFLNGTAIACIVFLYSLLFINNAALAMVVSVALFCVVVLASITGTVTPILLDKIGINPALASGPFITTANDLLGLAVYFWVARGLI